MSEICTHFGERIRPVAIVVTMWPEESTRTPQQACYYTAVAIVDGKEYRGRSRHGASYDLARVMLAAGVADAPVSGTHRRAIYWGSGADHQIRTRCVFSEPPAIVASASLSTY